MRVISGKYKGINLSGMDILGTRPTMDRVKESMFASIQLNLKKSICLDLFAGSGSLGIEALSNGASFCYFVDNNKIATHVIEDNLKKVKDNNYSIISDNYIEALKKLKNDNLKFDIIFLDPPYKFNLINNSIKKIIEYNLLNKDGIIVCEYEDEKIDTNKFDILKEKKYGSKNVIILKRGDLND